LRGVECRIELGPLCMHLDILSSLKDRERLGYIIGFVLSNGVVVASAFYAVANREESPIGFTADPLDTIAAHKAAWTLGLDVIAFFHSHPQGLARPSSRDLDSMKLWPIAWIIGGLDGVKAYKLDKIRGSLIECQVSCSPSP